MLIGPCLGDRAVGSKANFGPRGKKRKRGDIQGDPIVEKSHASPEYGLIVLGQQVSKSQPRSKIVLFSDRISVEAKTQIHGQTRPDTPLVLDEKGVFVLM